MQLPGAQPFPASRRRRRSAKAPGGCRAWSSSGCIPAAVFGFALDDWVNEHFYNKVCVAAMLILYGVIFIVLERRNHRRFQEPSAQGFALSGLARAASMRASTPRRTQRASSSTPARRSSCSRSPTSTTSTGRPRSRSACSRCSPSFREQAARVPRSSAACSPAARAPRRPSSRSSWPSL